MIVQPADRCVVEAGFGLANRLVLVPAAAYGDRVAGDEVNPALAPGFGHDGSLQRVLRVDIAELLSSVAAAAAGEIEIY